MASCPVRQRSSDAVKVTSGVGFVVARRVELWRDAIVVLPALGSRAAVLTFGDELSNLEGPDVNDEWLTAGGRSRGDQPLLAEAALRSELQPLADAVAKASAARARPRVVRARSGGGP